MRNDYRGLKMTTEYLFSVHGFKNIPYQYIQSVLDYSRNVRKIVVKVNFQVDENGRKWPETFSVSKVKKKSARSSAG